MIDVQTFCSQVENANSFFCQSVDLVGKIPSQFEFFYIIGFFLYFLMICTILIAPVLLLLKIIKGSETK